MLLKSKQLSQSAKAKISQSKIDMLRSLKGDKGETGLQGRQGTMGDPGPKGNAGMDGKTIVGDDGARGPAGPRGDKGERGEAIKGDAGQDGADGRGIVSVSIVGVNLVITYTDGTKVNVGRVMGQRGQLGPRGRPGGVIGDTSITNITEEVLSPEDSENLETIADSSVETLAKLTELVMNQQCQLDKINTELKINNTHLSIMTDEELLPGDEE